MLLLHSVHIYIYIYIYIFPDILVHEVLKNIACNIATIIESPKKVKITITKA